MQDRDSVRTHWRRRVRWARVFIVGMVCGGVQIFLLLATGVELKPWLAGLPLQWPLLVVGALSACSYLVFAFLEGYLAASRKGMIAAGSAAGRVVGGISALTVAIPIVVVVVMMLATPISTAGEVDPHDFRPQIVFVLFVFILLESLWAWGVSTLGGWIGGVVGQQTALRSISPI